jgi:hypothetical protein
MRGVVPENLIMVLRSRGASSVIRRLDGYTDGLFLVVHYARWQTRRVSGGNADLISSMPRYIIIW